MHTDRSNWIECFLAVLHSLNLTILCLGLLRHILRALGVVYSY